MSTSPALLGVEASLGGRRWEARPAPLNVVEDLATRLGIPEVVARVLAGRGVTAQTGEAALNPRLRDLLPNPSAFLDMDKAALRLADAVRHGETIGVFGDYDVDGATSAALLLRYLRAVEAAPVLYVPDRMTEGYGPQPEAMRKLAEQGVGVLVTVDCGATAHDALVAAREAGLDVIVADHHLGVDPNPPAVAVINPKRFDETTAHRALAAVGVTFLLVVALNRSLREMGFFSAVRPEPDLMALTDLVALGTVCDVVPLDLLNRAFVSTGLRVMQRGGNVGLQALLEVAGVRDGPDAGTLGYQLGPRINAGGRVGRSDLGARLLSTDDPEEASRLATELDDLNAARKDLEAAMLAEAIEQAESASSDPAMIVVAGEDWHPGIVGIVAGRLKDRLHRPVLAVAKDGPWGKGSGRSVPGVDLGSLILAAREAGLVERGGGHAMAAGLTVSWERLSALTAFLDQAVRAAEGAAAVPTLVLDGVLAARGVTPGLIDTIEAAGPFGADHPKPQFAVGPVHVQHADIVGSGHVRVRATDQSGGRVEGIAFRAADTDLGVALLAPKGRAMVLAGTLERDTWQGRNRARLIIEDGSWAF